MIKTDEASLRVLNTLIALNHDAQAGYETAAADARDPALARFFGEAAARRMEFVDELSRRVRGLRSEAVKQGSILARVHRAIIDAKSADENAPDHAVLVECERAEDIAVRGYRDALEAKDVDEQTRKIIQRQYELVQLAHDQVREKRDSPAYANK
jgi:uncharacterized protein (TIGR02284 family)